MKAIALLSSGLDSVAALAIASRNLDLELALSFDYGQRAAEREIEYSRKICEHFKLRHKVIRLDWLAEITDTALVNSNVEIPVLSETDILEAEPSKSTEASAKAVWVPNRNGVMLNIAASFAESLDCKYIITGFNGEEAKTFPDNSPEFVKALERGFAYSTQNRVRVFTPLSGFSKSEILKRALETKAPLAYSWSCYYGGKKPCKSCESCVRRARAFKELGVEDPLFKRLEV
ncbi:MAG: 7-cyano-7-deazaguanine synthase QueC [Methanosarcinaceae archaeon]|nr:7-cyano-7-deazaguanine synthase QueC [Methanosarcinaceae archaeon]MDD4332129.1 7-cyano-7-deazaguanine synthase QueC [Methanosarcinaceae archaeon]MDD4749375.1 7-cyano-7-deazaguanine synthase QueC [Methanosarcinaceae archaeon]